MRLIDQRNNYRLDLTAWTVSLSLGALILLLILTGSQVVVSATLSVEQTTGLTGPWGPLTLRFSRPVQQESIPVLAQIDPPTAGRYEWPDSQTAHFIPVAPFQLGVAYTFRLRTDVVGVNGERLRQEKAWTFNVRPPRLVYLSAAGNSHELWTVGLDGAAAKQLTLTHDQIYDFDAAPDGDYVAYTAINDQKGIDLWLVGRDGGEPRRLLDCGKDRCVAPAWSPDSRQIAYSRQSTGLAPDAPLGAPRPWLVTVQTSETSPVYTDTQTIGYGASWSPDGKWLASVDGIQGVIRVLDLSTGKTVLLNTNTGETGSWSPDSRYLLYTNINSVDDGIRTAVMQADFTTGETATLMGKDQDDRDYGYRVPAWSPAGNQWVIGLKSEAGSPAEHLWVIQPDLLGGPMIAAEPGYTYGFYHWDPWGHMLVFQRSKLVGNYHPEVVVWQSGQGVRAVADMATQPLWLP